MIRNVALATAKRFALVTITALMLTVPAPQPSIASLTDAIVIGVAGRVTLELISSVSDYSNTLSVTSPRVARAVKGCQLLAASDLPGEPVMSEKRATQGCRVDLDADPDKDGIQPFAAGTRFEFANCSQFDPDPECELVWFSGTNSDGINHLRVTPLDTEGKSFRLNWEDLEGGGDNDFNDLIATLRVAKDQDEDGLWDDWETEGVDANGDGNIDLNLKALGADPLHKDIFLKIDYMVNSMFSHRPKDMVTATVISAFQNAPVTNPDGTPGIRLHIEVDDALPFQDVLDLNCGGNSSAFDTLKKDLNIFGADSPRRLVYHYAIFAHRQSTSSTRSGCAETPGNDFIVTLGGWNADSQTADIDGDGLDDRGVGTISQQAGTLMHELGHNLGLRHGGGDAVRNKPNYLSNMNPLFQMIGIPPDRDGLEPLTGKLDWSHAALPALDESNLDESKGIGDGDEDTTLYFCPGDPLDVPSGEGVGNGAIDWNCDATIGASMTAIPPVDVNGDGNKTVLQGFDDWEHLVFDFQGVNDFEDGVHQTAADLAELDFETYKKLPAFADLAIQSSFSPNVIDVGGRLSYAVTVTNSSLVSATDVSIVLQLDAGLTYLEGASACTSTASNQWHCAVGSLNSGESKRIALSLLANASAGRPANTAQVNMAQLDSRPRDNRVSSSLQVINQRVSDSLLLFYSFEENTGNIAHELSGALVPNHLTYDVSAAQWNAGSLSVTRATSVSSSGPLTHVNAFVRDADVMTFEAWVTPAQIKQTNPAHLLTLADPVGGSNFTLNQGRASLPDGDLLDVRLRTTETGDGSRAGVLTPNGTLSPTLCHVVITYDTDKVMRIYINGQLIAERVVAGALSNWAQAARLVLANDGLGQQPWLGQYHLLAVYGRALTPNEVQHNFQAGPLGSHSIVRVYLPLVHTTK